MKYFLIFLLMMRMAPAVATDIDYQDLPPAAQVEAVLDNNINVQAAAKGVQVEQASQRKWDSGNYEFNLRAGSAQRNIAATGQNLREWDVALERPLRWVNKVLIDGDIGAEGVSRAGYALGDARHEAARQLLHLWFNWQREQAQAVQWQQQVDILRQQAGMTEKRMLAGDAPRMELNLAQAAAAQASVALQQASMRAQLAASELKRPFPELALPAQVVMLTPLPLEHDLAWWQQQVMEDNHELGMAQAESRIQQLMAKRSSADRLPDPTVGVRYSSEKEGEEKIAGIYVSVPISFGLRGASSEISRYHADIAYSRELATRRRLEGDVYAAYTQAAGSYLVWQQAQQAAGSVRENAELVARACTLGESSLSETLNARRQALESSLAATMAQLDANETRYRLLLDAHLLWAFEDEMVKHNGDSIK